MGDNGVPLMTDPKPHDKNKKAGPVVTPALRKLLTAVLVLFSLLLINSVYLGAVDFVQWWTGERLEAGPYIWAFFAHLVLGLIITIPVIVYGIAHARRGYNRPNRQAVAMGWGAPHRGDSALGEWVPPHAG